jgi:hypothetical protein
MRLTVTLLAFAAVLADPSAPASAQEMSDPDPRQIAQFISVVATVESVDRRRRKVTLVGPDGDTQVIRVGPDIEDFDQVEVGDEVEIDFFQDMVTEIREPTAEELETPLRIIEARPEDNPGMTGLKTIRAVVTIDSIDRENLEVTVRGPMGGKRTLPVIFPERLDQVEVGSTVVVTYTEAMAVSLVER